MKSGKLIFLKTILLAFVFEYPIFLLLGMYTVPPKFPSWFDQSRTDNLMQWSCNHLCMLPLISFDFIIILFSHFINTTKKKYFKKPRKLNEFPTGCSEFCKSSFYMLLKISKCKLVCSGIQGFWISKVKYSLKQSYIKKTFLPKKLKPGLQM